MKNKTPRYERRMNAEYVHRTGRIAVKLDMCDSIKIQRSKDLRRSGAPREALAELMSDPHWEASAEALKHAAHAHNALGEHDRALACLNECEKNLRDEMFKLHTNRSMTLGLMGDCAGADREAKAALAIDSHRYTAWVNRLAAQRDRDDQLEAVVEEMKVRWPSWYRDADLRSHIEEDVSLRHVRAHRDFERLFEPMFKEGE